MTRYGVGVVAGRFRILHKAHKELILKAYSLCDTLHIIINDDHTIDRIGTIEDIRISIAKVLQGVGGHGTRPQFHIHVVDNLSGLEWDQKVLELVPDMEVIFNSKEDYCNEILVSEYLNLRSSQDISASQIESDFINNRHLIAHEYRPVINKKIVITGIESCGKTSLVQKLASYYDTIYSGEYGRTYSDEFMGLDEDSFTAHDFTFIAMEQIMQNKRMNQEANGLLFIDSDTVVTKYYMGLYGELKAGFDRDAFIQDVALIDAIIANYADDIDMVIYLEPNVQFVDDGLRFLAEDDARRIRNQELKDMYAHHGIELIILENKDYDETFYQAIDLIDKTFKAIQ